MYLYLIRESGERHCEDVYLGEVRDGAKCHKLDEALPAFLRTYLKSGLISRISMGKSLSKTSENRENVMKETKGAWRKHPAFKDMDDAIDKPDAGKAR